MTTPSFLRFATATLTTQRNPAPVGGKVSAPVDHLTGIKCTPPEPISAETAQLFSINTPRESKIIYIDGVVDIKEGDLAIISSITYRVQAVSEYYATPFNVLAVALSEVK